MDRKRIIDFCTDIALVLVLMSALGVSVYIQYGGLSLNRESATFLVNYWDTSRTVLQRVFDPLGNDWGLYQARELSYFIDLLDAQFIKASINCGNPHFFSLSFFIFAIGIVLIFQFCGKRLFKNLDPGALLAVNVLFLLLPAVFWGSNFFRSAKPGCAAMLAVMAFGLYYFFLHIRERNTWLWPLIFGSELLMLLFDRQGMFMAATLTVGCGILLIAVTLLEKDPELNRKTALLCFGSLGVVLLGTLYNLYLGPWFIFQLNGYYPKWDYQTMELQSVFNLRGGLIFMLTNIGGMFGGFGMIAGAGLILLIGGGLILPWFKYRRRTAIYTTAAFVFLLCAMTAAANLMAVRHPALLWPDVIRGGYFLPNAVVFMFFFLLSLNSLMEIFTNRKKAEHILFAALLLPLAGNVRALPEMLEIMSRGYAASEYSRVQTLLQVLREPKSDYQELMLTLREHNVVAAIRGERLLRYAGAEEKITEWIYLKED